MHCPCLHAEPDKRYNLCLSLQDTHSRSLQQLPPLPTDLPIPPFVGNILNGIFGGAPPGPTSLQNSASPAAAPAPVAASAASPTCNCSYSFAQVHADRGRMCCCGPCAATALLVSEV